MSESSSGRGRVLKCVFAGTGILAILVFWTFSSGIPENKSVSAIRLIREGKTSDGLALLEQYLQENPDDFRSRKQLIDFYRRDHKPDAADVHLQRLIDVPVHREFALRTLAGQAVLKQDYVAAEKWLNSLRELFPDDQAVALTYGEVLYAQGRPVDAIPFIEQSLRLQPERAETYLLLAEALNDAGRTQEMIEPLESCLRLDPDNAAAHANLAFALQAAGRSADAIQEAEWCLARNPDLTSVRLILAAASKEMGQMDSAWEHVQRLRSESPDYLDAALLEADILFFRGRGAEVYDRLQAFSEKHSGDRRFVSYMLRAATARKDRELASHWKQIMKTMLNDAR